MKNWLKIYFNIIKFIVKRKNFSYIKAFVYGNLGDDLFVDAIVTRYPREYFCIVGAKEFENYYNYNNLTYFSYDRTIYKILNGLSRLFYKMDFVSLLILKSQQNIYITGSDFIEKNTDAPKLDQRFWNKKLYLIGINFGPFRSKAYLETYRKAFKNVASICVRDKSTFNYFNELNNIKYAPDVVFNLKNRFVKNRNNNSGVIISVINLNKDGLDNNNYQKMYVQQLVKIVNLIVSANKRVTLVSFCNKQGDGIVINQILNRCNKTSLINVVTYTGKREAILQILYDSEAVIATRYHAMILGMMYNKPTLPIIYDSKMLNVFNDLQCSGVYFTIEKIESEMNELKDFIGTLYSNYLNPVFYNRPDIHFEDLDKKLGAY